MTNNISLREWEALSAYLDGQLAQKERQRLEGRLKSSTELRQALEDLRRTRMLLRSQPKLRAPRNFTLTPEMVGQRASARTMPRAYPAFRLVSALASVLFVIVLIGDFFTAAPPVPTGGPPSVAMMKESQAEPEAAVLSAAPAEEAALEQFDPESSMLAVPSEEVARSIEAPAAEDQAAKSMPEGEETETDAGIMQAEPVGGEVVEETAQSIGRSTAPLASPGLLRALEVGLAVLAVLAGLAAFLLRRSVS